MPFGCRTEVLDGRSIIAWGGRRNASQGFGNIQPDALLVLGKGRGRSLHLGHPGHFGFGRSGRRRKDWRRITLGR